MKNLALKSNIKFTYEDYCQLPEDKRYELIDGEFYMTPSPLVFHQDVSMEILYRLKEHVLKYDLGRIFHAPMDLVFSDENVVQPDILFISKKREGIIKRENIQGAPDLLIEILSPSTAKRDLIVKKHLYAKYGVLEYWIVDPDQQTVEVMEWDENGFKTLQVYPRKGKLRSKVLSKISLPLKDIFPDS